MLVPTEAGLHILQAKRCVPLILSQAAPQPEAATFKRLLLSQFMSRFVLLVLSSVVGTAALFIM